MLCQHCGNNHADYCFIVHFPGGPGEYYACSECVDRYRRHMQELYESLRNDYTDGVNTEPIVQRKLGEDAFPLDAGEDIHFRRLINERKELLRVAVAHEDFERAAKLRDEIMEMEKGVHIYDS